MHISKYGFRIGCVITSWYDMFACFLCIILLWTYFSFFLSCFLERFESNGQAVKDGGSALRDAQLDWVRCADLETWKPETPTGSTFQNVQLGTIEFLSNHMIQKMENRIKTGLKEPLEVISFCSFLILCSSWSKFSHEMDKMAMFLNFLWGVLSLLCW